VPEIAGGEGVSAEEDVRALRSGIVLSGLTYLEPHLTRLEARIAELERERDLLDQQLTAAANLVERLGAEIEALLAPDEEGAAT